MKMVNNYWQRTENVFCGVHLPLLLVIIMVLLCLWGKRRKLEREFKRIPSLTISKQEADLHFKNISIKRCTLNLLMFILLIEFLPNAFAVCSEATLFYSNSSLPHTYKLSNSCSTRHDTVQAAKGARMMSGLVFLPYQLSLSFHLLLIPFLCFLLKFLRRAYLCHDYSPVLKHWAIYLSLRFGVLLFMMSCLSTLWLFLITESILYILDLSMYIVYARRFYLVLLSRAKEARLHCEYSEFISRSRVLSRYYITIIAVSIPLFLIVIQVVMENVMEVLNLVLVNSCYFNHISQGLIPILPVYPNVKLALKELGGKVDVVWLVLSIARKSIILFLYLSLLVIDSISYFTSTRWRSLRIRNLSIPLLSRK